ncbi:MAG: hypothetical protein Ct9H300mP1_16380 [Planctomycetaceae bacterium]|nr:MAG: hypothetical protein Ct9H300mP1_16380 [Planctomycetaceae bacterium]
MNPKIEDVTDGIRRLEVEVVILSPRRHPLSSHKQASGRATSSVPPEDRVINRDGTNRRYQFTAFHGAHLDGLWALGPFDGYHIDHPVPWPVSDNPGKYTFPKLRGYIDRIVNESGGRIKSFL